VINAIARWEKRTARASWRGGPRCFPDIVCTRGGWIAPQSQAGLYLVCGIHLLLHLILPPSQRVLSATLVGSFNKSKNVNHKVAVGVNVATASHVVVSLSAIVSDGIWVLHVREKGFSQSPTHTSLVLGGGHSRLNAFASNDTNFVHASSLTSVNIFRCFPLCV